MRNLQSEYFNIQNSFQKGEISMEEYGTKISAWMEEYGRIIKASQRPLSVDPSRGGKLIKKEGYDKTGKKTTKWVKREDFNKPLDLDNSSSSESDDDGIALFTPEEWQLHATTASDVALKNALKHAKNNIVSQIAQEELFKRDLQLKKYTSLSLIPPVLTERYLKSYIPSLTAKQTLDIVTYFEHADKLSDKLMYNPHLLDAQDKAIINSLDKAIRKHSLKDDLILFQGLYGKNAAETNSYLKHLRTGDVYQHKDFSNTSLSEGDSISFHNLFKTTTNMILQIYAEKGQQALPQSKGFILPRNAKFQFIDRDGDKIRLKLLKNE